MQLEDYFDFLAPDDVRVKGTRIGVESILYEYIHRGQSPDEIVQRLASLTLEQVYATILYYLSHRAQLDAYLADWLEFGRQAREVQAQRPAPSVTRLRERLLERASLRAAG